MVDFWTSVLISITIFAGYAYLRPADVGVFKERVRLWLERIMIEELEKLNQEEASKKEGAR